MRWPDLTTAPRPLSSGWTTNFTGAGVLGTVIWAGLAPSTMTVGSPAFGWTVTPPAFASGVRAEPGQTRKTIVSVGADASLRETVGTVGVCRQDRNQQPGADLLAG